MGLTLNTPVVAAGPACAVELSEEQFAQLGAKTKTPAVTVTVGGHTERLRVSRMGGVIRIGFSKKVRDAFGFAIGDQICAAIALDLAERTVTVPPELDAAFMTDADVRAAFDSLAFTHRREFAEWVAGAKQQETRDRRAAKALDMLRAGQKLS